MVFRCTNVTHSDDHLWEFRCVWLSIIYYSFEIWTWEAIFMSFARCTPQLSVSVSNTFNCEPVLNIYIFNVKYLQCVISMVNVNRIKERKKIYGNNEIQISTDVNTATMQIDFELCKSSNQLFQWLNRAPIDFVSSKQLYFGSVNMVNMRIVCKTHEIFTKGECVSITIKIDERVQHFLVRHFLR